MTPVVHVCVTSSSSCCYRVQDKLPRAADGKIWNLINFDFLYVIRCLFSFNLLLHLVTNEAVSCRLTIWRIFLSSTATTRNAFLPYYYYYLWDVVDLLSVGKMRNKLIYSKVQCVHQRSAGAVGRSSADETDRWQSDPLFTDGDQWIISTYIILCVQRTVQQSSLNMYFYSLYLLSFFTAIFC